MVTLPSGNEAVLLGCEDFNSNRWDNNNIHGYKGMTLIFKLFWQGEHLEWKLLTQSLRYSRTEAVAMLIPDSMTDCTAKCRYHIFTHHRQNPGLCSLDSDCSLIIRSRIMISINTTYSIFAVNLYILAILLHLCSVAKYLGSLKISLPISC